MTGRFNGRAAIMTGGGSGIALATAQRLASEGAEVVLLDPDAKAVAAAAEAIAAAGGRCATVIGASTDAEARRAAIDAAGNASGGIVVNAGASFLAKGADATEDDWLVSLRNNVVGYAQMTADALALLEDGGAVINVASVSAHIAQPSRWTYNATKGAVVALTRCQALDLAPRGIRVNSVSPAWIWTPVVARLAGDEVAARREEWGRYHLLGRIGEAGEVAAAICFLASEDASFITGADLPVDGGYLAVGGEGASHGADLYSRLREG